MSDELFPEPAVALPAMPLSEHVVEDYVATGLSLKEHPVRFFRERLAALGVIANAKLRGEDLQARMRRNRVTVAGLVLVRQRPGTAKGVIFMTLEDETDIANIIVWPKAFEKNRRTVMTARFLAVRGRLQRAGLVIHMVAERFIDLSAELPWLREGGDLFSPKFSGGPAPRGAALRQRQTISEPAADRASARYPASQKPRFSLEHDPEKWTPVLGKDHAPSTSWSEMPIRREVIAL
jgi:error-prone DNA polymerase